MATVGHKILVPGKMLHSPSGKKDWVVVSRDDNTDEVRIACVSKYMDKSTKELTEWELIENEKKE